MGNSADKQLMRIAVSSNGKEFFDKYTIPVDFLSNITVKVKNLDNNTKKVLSYIVRARKKV